MEGGDPPQPAGSNAAEPYPYHGVLFIPAIQLPASQEQIRNAYRDAIKQSIDNVKPYRQRIDSPFLLSKLEIAILMDGGLGTPRSQLFHAFQTLVAELYMLACISASRFSIDLDFPGGVDVRVYALDAPYANEEDVDRRAESGKSINASTSGPISSLSAFQVSRASWDRVLCAGQETMYKSFLDRNWGEYWNKCFANPTAAQLPGVRRIDAPPWNDAEKLRNTITDAALASDHTKHHTKVAVGGTFDHLHIGHKLLLMATIFVAQPGLESREITIGITGDELLVNKKHASVLESWDVRQLKTADFVESILVFHPVIPSIRTIQHFDEPGANGKLVKVTYSPSTDASGKLVINYVRISDPFGPTITDESITALVISAETRAGGKAVNDKRTEKGWAPLEIFEVDVLDPTTIDDTSGNEPGQVSKAFESKISSTEIRRRLEAGEHNPKPTSR